MTKNVITLNNIVGVTMPMMWWHQKCHMSLFTNDAATWWCRRSVATCHIPRRHVADISSLGRHWRRRYQYRISWRCLYLYLYSEFLCPMIVKGVTRDYNKNDFQRGHRNIDLILSYSYTLFPLCYCVSILHSSLLRIYFCCWALSTWLSNIWCLKC